MTDIAGAGSASAGLFRVASPNQEQQQVQTQQAQQDQDGQSIAERRIEQAEQGAGSTTPDPREQAPRTAGSAGRAELDARAVEGRDRNDSLNEDIAARARRIDSSVEITLSDTARQARDQAVQIANTDAQDSRQRLDTGIQQTESALDSQDFTRTVDRNRELNDAGRGESRAGRELGRVLDTFA